MLSTPRFLTGLVAALGLLVAQLQCTHHNNDVAPSITAQPQGATVLAPATATFTVTATGDPTPSYQWSLNGSAISGATSAAYTTPATTAAMNGGSYTVTVSNGVGSPVTSTAAILIVNAAPIITTQPAAASVTAGGTATFTVAATGAPAPTYQWYLNGAAITGATADAYTTPATTLANNGDSYTVTVSNGVGAAVTSSAAVLTVDQAQVLVTQPASVLVTAPATATFTVAATGNPLTYQWYVNGGAITGATSASYTTGPTSLAMNGNIYTVIVSGFSSPVTSASATLTVDAPPAITIQPASISITDPATATFSVTATGNPAPTFQWNLAGTPIGGATGSSYTTPATSLAMNGNSYTVTVSNGIGSPVTSNPAVLTVDQAVAITTQPTAQVVTVPATATFSVAASGFPAPTYQWNLNGVAITGATGASYTTPATTAAMNGGSYTVTVGNGIGSPVTSGPVVLTVDFAAAITTPPASASVGVGGTATFSVVATGNPAPTYQWSLGGTAIGGATGSSYTTPATTLAMSGNSYTVTVTNGIGSPVTSAAAILTVTNAAAITGQPASQTVTAPATATFTVTATGSPAPTYQWNLNGAAISGATGASYTTPTTTPSMNGQSYTVTVTNGIGSPVTSSAALLTVDYPAAITTPPASASTGVGGTATFSVVASGNPAPTYQWNLGGVAIGGATGSSYTTPAATLAMNGNSYTVTVGNGIGSAVTSAPAILTVTNAAAITTQPTAQTVTAPAPATFTVVASGSPAPSYQWNLNGTAIAGATSASYTTPATSLGMNGNSYTVTVGNGVGAPVTSAPALLTVDVAAAITVQPIGTVVIAPAPGTFTVTASGNPAPTYQWNLNGTAIAGATGASYTTPATTLAMDQSSYTVTVSNGIGSPVTSSAALLSVKTGPVITTQPIATTVVAPATATFTVAATGNPAPAYQWSLNGTTIPGATSASYTTPATSLALNGGIYTVSVSNGVGTAVTSNAALLTVDAAPAITTQPASVAVNAPSTATFTVVATGNPAVTYQWNLGGTPIGGATSASYTTPATSTAMDQNSYTVTVSNGIGSPVTSNAAILSVHTGPVITAQPQGVTVTAPATATFSVTATGNPAPSYQWSVNGVSIPGATSASYTTPATTLAMEFNNYAVTLTNGVGPSVTSNSAQLVVNVAPAITTQPQAQNISLNTPLNLSVVASGYPSSFNYQWYLNGSQIPGATSSSYYVASAQLTDSGSYYVTVDNGIGTPAQSAPATVTVSPTYTVSGTMTYANNGLGAPGIHLVLDTTPPQTQTTSSTGTFSFSNVPVGTWTITPSISGPTAVFYPAVSTFTVTNANVVLYPEVALGYVVSGNVSYSGSQTGEIYIFLRDVNYGTRMATAISSTGGWSIHGVPPGTYSLQAKMDTAGRGAFSVNDPQGSWPSNITVKAANVTGITMTIADHSVSMAGLGGPGLHVYPNASGALLRYDTLVDSNNNAIPTHYRVQWSPDAGFSTISDSRLYPEGPTNAVILPANGTTLVTGNTYYFRVRGEAGALVGDWTTLGSPVTIAGPAGGHTITGTVTFPQASAGPLVVVYVDVNSNTFYGTIVESPVSPQFYTITGVASGTFLQVGIMDQNQDGVIDAGDAIYGVNNTGAYVTVAGDLSGQDFALPGVNAQATANTYHGQYNGGSDNYALWFSLVEYAKHIVSATLVSGPNVVAPTDFPYNSNDQTGFWMTLVGDRPALTDSYGIQVVYSDGTSEILSPPVTAVLDAFVTNLSPMGTGNHSGNPADTQPTFTWTAPAAPPAGYSYTFSIWDNNGNTVWSIPSGNSNAADFSSTITSIVWGIDPTDGTNSPTIPSLAVYTQYSWGVQVNDAAGNASMQQVPYMP